LRSLFVVLLGAEVGERDFGRGVLLRESPTFGIGSDGFGVRAVAAATFDAFRAVILSG
jgi:hypothetical protein